MARTSIIGAALAFALSASAVSAQDAHQAEQPADAAASAPAVMVAADQTSPRGAVRVLTEGLESGNRQAILGVLYAATPEEQKLADAMADFAVAVAQLQAASRAAFAEHGSEVLGDSSADLAAALERLSKAPEQIDGDTATISVPGEISEPMTLTRVNGVWRLPMSEMSRNTDSAMMAEVTRDIEAQAAMFHEVSEKVQAGDYKTAGETREALDQRLLQAALERQAAGTQPADAAPATEPGLAR
jgi:hypothetical protein